MKETSIHPSLLSYLMPERGKIRLRLQPAGSQKAAVGSPAPPFLLFNDRDPLARTFRGAFVTDYGSILKEVNLLIQRDTVEWPTGRETALTNLMIDQYWQQAMTTRQDRAPEHSMLLAMQVGGQRQLLPFAPLFYCRTKAAFFEPPCPGCGHVLQLCHDDARLHAAGLPPYTASRRRFLFCPSCFRTNGQVWYTLERAADDPLTVRDCRQLILDFGKLGPDTGSNAGLPCLTCPQHDLCYGTQQAAHDTIFILSFYPFYLLITQGDSLDGFHLLALALESRPLSSGVEETASCPLPRDSAADREQKADHDPAIHTILENLAGKWQQEAAQQSSTDQHPPLHETPAPQDIPPGKDNPLTGDESLAATLPISGLPISGLPISDLPIGGNSTPDDLSRETVLIDGLAGHPPGDRETLQTATVLLSASPAANKHTPHPHTDRRTAEDKPTVQDDDLTETVILRPGEKP